MHTLMEFTYDNTFGLIIIAFLLGIYISFICYKTSQCTKNMTAALAILPALVCAALLAVNGNMGASIAVLGVFGLVRFRSVPGSSRDIINVFYAMAAGLLVATYYVFVAVGATLIIGLLLFGLSKFLDNNGSEEYELRILVPEDMNFNEVFGMILYRYFDKVYLTKVRTTNMGSLFELTYFVCPRANMDVKSMMDEIRTHNGNLNIIYCKCQQTYETL